MKTLIFKNWDTGEEKIVKCFSWLSAANTGDIHAYTINGWEVFTSHEWSLWEIK